MGLDEFGVTKASHLENFERNFQKVRRRKEISGEILVVVLVAKVISGVIRWWCKQESPDPPALGGDDIESEKPSEYVCSEGESSQTEGLVEDIIESRMVVHDGEIGEPSIDSLKAEYR
ncbi:unnamed protein product [Prunus armeniaca]